MNPVTTAKTGFEGEAGEENARSDCSEVGHISLTLSTAKPLSWPVQGKPLISNPGVRSRVHSHVLGVSHAA